jgi:predicted ATPase
MKLFGRDDECATLQQIVNSVRTGDSRALVLHGEAGVGKSALLDRLAEQAAPTGPAGWRHARMPC